MMRVRDLSIRTTMCLVLVAMATIMLAFATGALAGAFGVAAVSFWCVLVPAFILVGLLFVPDRKSHP